MSKRYPSRVNVLAARSAEGRSSFTLYILAVQWAERQEWSVERRFSEFEELRSRLAELVNDLPPLPAKTLTRILDANFVAQRKAELDKWIQILQQNDFIRRCSLYQSFLGVDANLSPAVLTAHLPVERPAVVDPQFGLNHAVYHPSEQLMFTACEDVHLLSKLERKLTNMRMPWEKQGGLAPLGCFATWKIGGESPRANCVIYYPVAAVCVCIIPSQRAAYVGLDNGRVHAYAADPSWSSFAPIGEHAVHNGRVTAIAYASRKSCVLSVGTDNHMCVIDAADRRARHSIAVGGGLHVGALALNAIRVDDDYERAFVASSTGTIFIYSTAMLPNQAPVLIHQLQGHTAPVKCLSYNRSDGLLFSGGDDYNIGVWTIAPGGSPNEVSRSRLSGMMTHGISKPITAICYAAPLQQVLTGYNDGYIAVWSVQTGRLSYGWKGHEHAVTQMLFDPQQRTLITAGHDGKVKLWQLKDESTIAKILDGSYSRKASETDVGGTSAAAAYLAAVGDDEPAAAPSQQPAPQTIEHDRREDEDIHSNDREASLPTSTSTEDATVEHNHSDSHETAQAVSVPDVSAQLQELSIEPIESAPEVLVSPSKSHMVEDLVQQTETTEIDLF